MLSPIPGILGVCIWLAAMFVCSVDASDHGLANQSVEIRVSNRAHSARNKAVEIAARIDQLVAEQLVENEMARYPTSSDVVFLRRVYLDIVGRIPTIQEASTFLESKDPDKRERLIDRLLDSYGYVSHQFNYFADLLRIKTKHRNSFGQPYIDYVKDALEANKPYDQLVSDLLKSSGPINEKGNGAVGYYIRDLGMPEDNMSNTVRVFMGTRLECAQCHDHPFDRWTQRQYFEMLAFMGGMKVTKGRMPQVVRRLKQVADKNGIEIPVKHRRAFSRAIESIKYEVRGAGTGVTRLPKDFLGDDGDPGDVVKAKTIFDDQSLVNPVLSKKPQTPKKKRRKRRPLDVDGATDVGARNAFADWITSKNNPRFAQVIANRLWKRCLGLGLIEPVDILDDGTVASNQELMNYLTQVMIDLDFDIKAFMRAVYYTKTYQAQSHGADITDPKKYFFPGPVLRRLTAEQIWDSLLVLTVDKTDRRRSVSTPRDLWYFGQDLQESTQKIKQLTDDELLLIAKVLAEKGMRGIRALPTVERRELGKYRGQLGEELRSVKKRIQKAKRTQNDALLRSLIARRTELTAAITTSKTNSQFWRASELSSPAPAGHLLRRFGQSDRNEVENANLEPSIPQILTLMNGYIEKRVIQNSNTVLIKNAVWQTSSKDKIKAIFLTVLSRLPSERETSLWLPEVNRSSTGVSRDLIWTLVNSNEFLFNR